MAETFIIGNREYSAADVHKLFDSRGIPYEEVEE